MADTVNINPDSLLRAATAVAAHLSAAAIPPSGALPPGAAPSPADVAAAGVAQLLYAKVDAEHDELMCKASASGRTTGSESCGLEVVDGENSRRIADIGLRSHT